MTEIDKKVLGTSEEKVPIIDEKVEKE